MERSHEARLHRTASRCRAGSRRERGRERPAGEERRRTQRLYRAAGWEQDGRKEEVLEGTSVVELRYGKRL